MALKLEGLCSQREAYWFYVWWGPIYERMQPYFTSPEMREAGLELAEIGAGSALRVLDVGAGTGTLSLQVAARVGASNLTLLDQSPTMLDQARTKPALAGATCVLSDAQVLPLGDAAFDRVVSSGAIYYFPRPVEAVAEMARVTKPGGKVLAMGSLQPKPRLIRLLAQVFNRFPTEAEYVGWFEDAGLEAVRYVHVTNPWNASAYAIAVVGTVPAGGATPAGGGGKPAAAAAGGALARVRSLLSLPLAIARFGAAMAAFALLGPLQVANGWAGQRRLARERAAAGK